ncbi:hypothetical protein C474_17114 [Halogeometricum pallidum JCM 14848]|uniref:Lipoprotein n=1 Tax=Halogeometricum pallidum JCM 14848 TaxID=1227487 RepID=M0CYY4_HALPD|nr:hypothetical protein [Halogeometricum pallidum]ELZ27089.1 hypothetical protein C474_17114 [Halogeometricum pallidum JCM 14848]
MPSTTSRRRLLALAGAVGLSAVSGCADRLSETTDGDAATLTFRLYDRASTLREEYVRDLNETRVPWDEAALAAAVNGTEDATQRRQPFPGPDPAWAKLNGTYYRLDEVVVGEEEVTHPVLRLHEAGRTDDADESTYVERDDLPKVDQRAVQIAYMAARARGNAGGVPWGLVQRGGYVYRDDDTANQSELLADDGPSRVAHRDRIWRVEVARETFHEAVYRPDADPVADSEAGIEEALRGRLVGARIDPETLSEAEREVFRRARGEGYTAEHPFPDAFVSVLKRLDERAYIDGNVTKDGGANDYPPRDLLRYGGAYYEYRLALETADEG